MRKRKIAHHLDGDAAHAEGERQAEIGIARHAGKHLDAVGDEFLHQESGIGRPRIEFFQALVQLRISARQFRVVFEIDGDEAKLGLVRDGIGHDFEHHGITERACGCERVRFGRNALLLSHRDAVGREQPLGIEFVDRAPNFQCVGEAPCRGALVRTGLNPTLQRPMRSSAPRPWRVPPITTRPASRMPSICLRFMTPERVLMR